MHCWSAPESLLVASLALLLLPAVRAIAVTSGSACSTDCGNVLDLTTTADVSCSQSGYTSGAGQIFESCVDCELNSGYSKNNQSDTEWALYNLRYVTSYCLFGYPSNPDLGDSPCITSKACGPFKDAVQFNNLSTNIEGYDYCTLWPATDTNDYDGCRACLQAGGETYIANFFAALQAGCEQQPTGEVTLGLQGSIFSGDNVNITSPSPVATVNPDWFDDGPISLGGKVGIAFGGLAFVLFLLGFFIVWNGKRRRRAFLRQLEAKHSHNGWPAPQQGGGGDFVRDTPLSQRPLRGWDDSPMSATTEKGFGRYFSPYSSQYNSPVSAQDGGPSMVWPDNSMGSMNHHMPSAYDHQQSYENVHWQQPANLSDAHVHHVGAESYEMHEVESSGSSSSRGKQPMQREPPVLGHPGHGRGADSPPRQYDVQQ